MEMGYGIWDMGLGTWGWGYGFCGFSFDSIFTCVCLVHLQFSPSFRVLVVLPLAAASAAPSGICLA